MTPTFDSEDLPTNTSGNEHFQRVVERAVSRRGFMLKSGVGAAAVAFLSTGLSGCGGGGGDETPASPAPATDLLGFSAISTATADAVSVAPGYTATVLAPWGTPLFSTGAGSAQRI